MKASKRAAMALIIIPRNRRTVVPSEARSPGYPGIACKAILATAMILALAIEGNCREWQARTRLASVFSSNMVLQHNDSVNIWGWDEPGKKVRLQFAGKTYNVNTRTDGYWIGRIATGDPGGPYQLVVEGVQKLVLSNILLGDVWICSGQSNMDRIVSRAQNAEEEIKNAHHPSIRLLKVEKVMSGAPLEDVSTNGWKNCSPETAGEFSAAAYYFARELQKIHNIPIGLITSTWGGTTIEQWMDLPSLRTVSGFEKTIGQIDPQMVVPETSLISRYEAQYDSITYRDPGISTMWKKNFVFADTAQMNLPGAWENKGLPDHDGTVWFQKTIDIPESLSGKELYLSLGKIDERDITWFNGERIGSSRGAGLERRYRIPKEFVKSGSNMLTVLVTDLTSAGGFIGTADELYIAGDAAFKRKLMPLSGNWRFQKGFYLSKEAPRPPHPYSGIGPSTLYNAMISPMSKLSIKGFLWYQGENNAKSGIQAQKYRELFPAMIRGWRSQWARGDLPFLFVQLAAFGPLTKVPGKSVWALLRESQLSALKLPNTAMVVTTDIGNPEDIHPLNKQEVGRRLALAAAEKVYRKGISGTSPVYKSSTIKDNKIIIEFTATGNGLIQKGGTRLKGFSIAGAEGNFVWAEAVIAGRSVIVSSPQIPVPKYVRYAWEDSPVEANLYNAGNLPVSPFRTDSINDFEITK